MLSACQCYVPDRALFVALSPPQIAPQVIEDNEQRRIELPQAFWMRVAMGLALAEKPEDFQALIAPVFKYANGTSDRIPLSDWHETTNGKSVGFRARSVVGGYWMKVLGEKWK